MGVVPCTRGTRAHFISGAKPSWPMHPDHERLHKTLGSPFHMRVPIAQFQHLRSRNRPPLRVGHAGAVPPLRRDEPSAVQAADAAVGPQCARGPVRKGDAWASAVPGAPCTPTHDATVPGCVLPCARRRETARGALRGTAAASPPGRRRGCSGGARLYTEPVSRHGPACTSLAALVPPRHRADAASRPHLHLPLRVYQPAKLTVPGIQYAARDAQAGVNAARDAARADTVRSVKARLDA